MKMTLDDFGRLKDSIEGYLQEHPGMAEQWRAQGVSRERLRWDLFYAIDASALRNDLRGYLSESHIDFALRSILPDPPLESGTL